MPRADYVFLEDLCKRIGVSQKIGLEIISELQIPSATLHGRVALTVGRGRRVAAHMVKARGKIDKMRAKHRGARTVNDDLVYFIQCERFVKIGRAQDVAARLHGLQKHTPFELTLLGTEEGGEQRERELHRLFQGMRHRGEWFRLEGALQAYVQALRDTSSRHFSRQSPIGIAQGRENLRLISKLGGYGEG